MEAGFEGVEQGVGRAGPREAVPAMSVSGDDEERDVAAVDAAETASGGVVVCLVPDDHDGAGVSVRGGALDAWDPVREPCVAGSDGSAVHVVGVVGDDEAERWWSSQAVWKGLEAP